MNEGIEARATRTRCGSPGSSAAAMLLLAIALPMGLRAVGDEPGPSPATPRATAPPASARDRQSPVRGAPTLPLPLTWGEATARARRALASPGRPRLDAALTPTTSAVPTIPVVATPPVVPPTPQVFPIDFTTALRLAEVENPEIAEARQRILEALALKQAAYALMLPTLNAGPLYHGHNGNLQRSSGRILSVSRQSVYVGGGSRLMGGAMVAVPAVNIASPLTDAIFEPLAARQNVARTQFEAAATANAVLLDVSTLYYDMVAAAAALELRRETEAEATEASRMTSAYARSGQGYVSDADRAATLLRLIHREVERSEEELAVASIRLSRRLHLDQVVRVQSLEPGISPIALIDLDCPVEGLISSALRGRPEMGARGAAVEVAETRLRQEVARPFLPTLWLGFSGAAYGGGSNLVPPLVGNFGGRTDFDVRAFWTLRNLGLGNLAIQKRRRAAIGQALGEQSRTINVVRREVSAAHAQAVAARSRVETTRRQLSTSEDGFRQDLDRLQNTVGRPIELTNSLELLAQARLDHLRAILDNNRAQLRLFVSLGSPPPLDRPATDPLPPAPIASPPLPLAPAR